MKRVEVIADEESEIIEAVRRMSEKYDFVVTSGGIGPTYVTPPALLLAYRNIKIKTNFIPPPDTMI